MNLSRSLRNPFGCARRFCRPTSARRVRWRWWKNREAGSKIRAENRDQFASPHVSDPVQLRHDFRRRGGLRSSGRSLEPLSGLSRMRQTPRSQEPPAADRIPPRRLLEGRQLLILPSRAKSILCIEIVLTSHSQKTCYTFAAFDCCQLRSRFSGRPSLPASLRTELALSTAQCRGRRVKNIFVGNLSFNTNEDEVRQLFEGYGQVDRVSIMTDRDTGRSRGFGFVEMTSNEDGEKAITALNGSQVGGRTINVNEARPKAERGGGGGFGGGRDRGDRGDRGNRGGRERARW